jgi:hypothetical protein
MGTLDHTAFAVPRCGREQWPDAVSVAALAKARMPGAPVDERLGLFANPWLLIIDELSWLRFEPNAAHLFF